MDNDKPKQGIIFIAAKGDLSLKEPGPYQNLYLGGVDALEESVLAQAHINAVLTIMTEKEKRKAKLDQKIDDLDDIQKHMAFTTHDDNDTLASYFVHAIDFIRQTHSFGMNVLVHCKTGGRQAATAVAAYLVSEYGVGWEAALQVVRERRGGEQIGEKWRYELSQQQEKLKAMHKPQKQT